MVFVTRRMRFVLVVCSLLVMVSGEHLDDDEWIDPTDMLNYDATTKTMRKPPETTNYDNIPTKRREYIRDSSPVASLPEVAECNRKVVILEREVNEMKRKTASPSQLTGCNPVFKRFLAKLLKEVQKLGLPSDVSSDVHYDAEIKLSRQAEAEIRKLLEEDNSWRAGALDEALSQILVCFKRHDYEAWKWRFEDTFGVELDTVVRIAAFVLIIVVVICSEIWSTVSWFCQFRRIFAICFFISIIWNWFYLYKIAFAAHQTNIVKMESINEKCTGVRKIDWKDNLKEWFRSTWTLQDDPCKQYYEVLMVNPILLVPPTKAISVTITTFITEPLKHFGQGISEFLRALLKDLPVTLQIPVLLTIVLSILVFMYGSAQAVIHHGMTRPLRWGRQDPPPPAVEQHQVPRVREFIPDDLAGGDSAQQRANRAEDEIGLRQRRRARPTRRPPPRVESLGQTDGSFSKDEVDTEQCEDLSELEELCDQAPVGGAAEDESRERGHANRSKDAEVQPHVSMDDSKLKTGNGHKESDKQTQDTSSLPKAAHVEDIGIPTQETSTRS